MKGFAQTAKELQRVVEFGSQPPFGQVSGHDQEVGTQVVVVPKIAEVLLEPREKRIEWSIPTREISLGKTVILPELHIGEMEERQRTIL
jgi:hypothetical protein